MAMKFMPIYYDALSIYDKCTDEEFGRLIRAALRFVIDGTEPKFTPDSHEDLYWNGIKAQTLRDTTSYAESVAAGKAGAEKRWGSKKGRKDAPAPAAQDDQTKLSTQDYIARIQRWKEEMEAEAEEK